MNATHNTADCKALNRQQSQTSTGKQGGGGGRRGAFASQASGPRGGQQSGQWDTPKQTSFRNSSGAGSVAGRILCDACGRSGHDSSTCRVQNPNLALPGWEPPGSLLKRLFHENKAKLAAYGSGGGCGAGGSGAGNSAPSVAGSQQRRANVAASTAGGDSDFDDEDYAPSDRRGMFTARHRARCHATLLQQPQPVSFDAVEVKADVYPPPKVPARAKEASIVQPGSTIEPTVTVTFSLSDVRDPRRARRVHDIIRMFEEDLIQSEEQPARPVSPAPLAEPEHAVIPDESTTQTPSVSLAMPTARVKLVRYQCQCAGLSAGAV